MLKPYHSLGFLEAGCDEAGRGCLAGPVFAAAVILPDGFNDLDLDDSKKLSSFQRDQLRVIIESRAITYGIGVVSEEEIDEINILNASFLAMHRAIKKLDPVPAHLLIDGNRFNPYNSIKHTCIIKGDGIYSSIAAASILAKTHRDEHMTTLHAEFPSYGWNTNKGYPTRKHREAIQLHGPSVYHRRSFRLLDEQLEFDFN